MTTKGKKIFLALTIVVPFLIYCVIYYTPMIRNAPFKSSEFVSLQFKWGTGKTLVNSYDSKTGDYQYLDGRDSLIKTNVKLRTNDIIYLHSKANELGLWNFPAVIANQGTELTSDKVLRYEMQFNYQRKSKKVIFLTDYNEIPKLKDVASQMQKLISQSINDAEERYGNK
jgi:ribonuclease BN (tRNA processing enzyme)